MWLLMPLSGILMGLCLAFPAIGFLEWVAMIPALLFFFAVARDKAVRYRRLYLYGFCYYFFFCWYSHKIHFLTLYYVIFLTRMQ